MVVTADPPGLLDGLAPRLAPLETRSTGRSPEISIELVGGEPLADLPAPEGVARLLFEPQFQLGYYPASDELHLRDDGVAARSRPVDGTVRICVRAADPRARYIATHLFFALPLLEILKRRGRYHLHAAGVTDRDRAALICGAAGAGKSTIGLACARAGFGLLGDDLVLLRWRDGALRARAFHDRPAITHDSTRFFPDLADLGETDRTRKREVPFERIGGVLVADAEPVLLLFPRVRAQGAAVATPLSADEALLELVPNVVRTDTGAAQAHLDALAALARACPAYRLDISDPADAPALIRDLLSART